MNPADKPEDAATARLLVTCPDQPGIIPRSIDAGISRSDSGGPIDRFRASSS